MVTAQGKKVVKYSPLKNNQIQRNSKIGFNYLNLPQKVNQVLHFSHSHKGGTFPYLGMG